MPLIVIAMLLSSRAAFGAVDGPATLPVAETDVTLLDSSGWNTYSVRVSDGDYTTLQAAYDQAVADDANTRIQVEAGHSFGRLVLRDRNDKSHWIYIEPDDLGAIPSAGVRASASDTTGMYEIDTEPAGESGWMEAIWAEHNAGYTRIIGAQVRVIKTPGTPRTRSHIIRIRADLQSPPATIAEMPDHVILDRIVLRFDGLDGELNSAHMVGLYGTNLALINSHIYGVAQGASESLKAISMQYSPGPVLVENNLLASDGINFFLGAAAAAGPDSTWIPQDVTLRGNHLYKDPAWFGETYSSVKNNFEIKNAKRVLAENNIFENNWSDAQAGTMILIRAEAHDGVCEDVTFRYNKLVNTPAVFSIIAMDYDGGYNARRPANRLSIHDNVAYKIGEHSDFQGIQASVTFDCADNPTQTLRNLHFVHNTFDDLGAAEALAIKATNLAGGENIVIRDNILSHGTYGWKATSTPEGTASMDATFGPANYTWDYNVGASFPSGSYPAQNNDYPTITSLQAEFEDAANYDLRLVANSRYRVGGSDPPFDGSMRGADVELINVKTANVIQGIDDPPDDPPPGDPPPDPPPDDEPSDPVDGGTGPLRIIGRPNPFNPRTVIAFVLPEGGETTASVYDPVGRCVQMSALGTLGPGAHQFVFNATNTQGRNIVSGTYFARVESSGHVGVVPITLIR